MSEHGEVLYFIKRETFYTAANGHHIMRADHYRTQTWCGTNNDKKNSIK